MSVKRFMLAIASLAALGAILASSAAAAPTIGGQWYVNGSGTPLSGSETVACEAEGSLKLEGTVAGTEVNLAATNVECIESTIFNEGTAKDKGKLKFTGVTVTNIPTCSVEGGTVETEQLNTALYMEGTTAYDKFTPEGARFAIVHLQGAECPVAGNKPVKGYVFGRAANATGVEAAVQPLEFSAAIDATAGSALVFAGNPAHLTGTAVNALTSGHEYRAE